MKLENVPENEPEQITNIVNLTLKQLERRYADHPPMRRGVHAKDHGCVQAKFSVLKDLPNHLRVGIFATPGKEFDAWIRFSNADVLARADSTPSADGKPAKHGSRGMAIQLQGVTGEPLIKGQTPLTQDFLMINQPMFAFANVADYEVLSQVLEDNNDDPTPFFPKQLASSDPMVKERALATGGIVKFIQATPVASPVEVRYFSAAPFMFGTNQVMKYSAKPTSEPTATEPDLNDPDYLRKALIKRLSPNSPAVTFEFQVQLQDACEIESDVDGQIENASVKWSGESFPFETVATITILPQDFDTKERRDQCERLILSPWHGIVDHKPLGGINRLRRAVYEASSSRRLQGR